MQPKKALTKERETARKLVDSYNVKLKNLENLIYGIHGEEPVKLADYALSLRRPSVTKPVPGKVMITSIRDDEDGEGFIVTWNSVDGANRYEIEKGVAPETSTVVLAPPYPFLKSTTKITLTDDDVVKGRRYFYRVRALNSSGAGEWSEPVYKVQ
ncbi:MAG TPA: fibronectin type III domain-containing protein [Bacteroidales bacterium]|nr:fibronectin type III domain-containing protein [Bacteroidales bacterium]